MTQHGDMVRNNAAMQISRPGVRIEQLRNNETDIGWLIDDIFQARSSRP
jgi:hypothetical protein